MSLPIGTPVFPPSSYLSPPPPSRLYKYSPRTLEEDPDEIPCYSYGGTFIPNRKRKRRRQLIQIPNQPSPIYLYSPRKKLVFSFDGTPEIEEELYSPVTEGQLLSPAFEEVFSPEMEDDVFFPETFSPTVSPRRMSPAMRPGLGRVSPAMSPRLRRVSPARSPEDLTFAFLDQSPIMSPRYSYRDPMEAFLGSSPRQYPVRRYGYRR